VIDSTLKGLRGVGSSSVSEAARRRDREFLKKMGTSRVGERLVNRDEVRFKHNERGLGRFCMARWWSLVE
jgi:hypothetical protein